ncbi:hypothetical protein CYLTODRAFT_424461 [Cylindrobasidium torrendii FP15055 ss-10]|uniref:Uncharacterized protein n=1 Tax=Cylindrobasidium torrendii FP15055 ss-10 TaxID=1314674 RepID=A0A0D7B541_9AGAR|nr:hypothetical protein CYLTODRAFT_424461 [Cylindrobasidium torrendii FP15055 ss-10]
MAAPPLLIKDNVSSVAPQADTTMSVFNAISPAASGLAESFQALIESAVTASGQHEAVEKKIEDTAKLLATQDIQHNAKLHVIQVLLEDLLKECAIESLRQEVEEQVNQDLDRLVDEEVTAYLTDKHLNQETQRTLDGRKLELSRERRNLHNAESKRANGLLRRTQNKPSPVLNTFYMDSGEVSTHFPKTLADLQELDDGAARELATDYGIAIEADDQYTLVINRILIFFGLRYQCVKRRDGTFDIDTD